MCQADALVIHFYDRIVARGNNPTAMVKYMYMLVPKCALSQFANWDPSLRTGIYLSQFGNWDHRHNLSLQTGIDREIMNI